MTEKQKKFVDEYLVDLNATQAAIRAGYSEATAVKIASENLTKPDIQAAIQKARDRQSARTEITADEVMRNLFGIAMMETDEPIKWSDKIKAWEMIGKRLGMFEKQEQRDATIRVVFGDGEDDYAG